MTAGHPEDPARLGAIENRLVSQRLMDVLAVHAAPEASHEQLARVHEGFYLQWLKDNAPRSGLVHIDPDTAMNPGTWSAAVHAAGAGVLAVDQVMQGAAQNAFCNVRPPGHHAGRAAAMGFCFLNNAAVAAAHALSYKGIERVAILDFDVHYGNGTRDIFLNDERVIMCSIYQEDLYPFQQPPLLERQHVNAALPSRGFAAGMRQAIKGDWQPALEHFRPDFYVVSAGFDGHIDDDMSLADMATSDYRWITDRILALAQAHAGGRLVSTLEGGYALEALAESACGHIRCLMDV